MESNFSYCIACGADLQGTELKCLHCGRTVIETDLIYLNELERLVLHFFDAALDAEIPFELSASPEGRDPYLLAIENLLRHVKVYHFEGDGCREMLAGLGKDEAADVNTAS